MTAETLQDQRIDYWTRRITESPENAGLLWWYAMLELQGSATTGEYNNTADVAETGYALKHHWDEPVLLYYAAP